MQMKVLKINVQNQYSSLTSKGNKDWNKVRYAHSFENKIMDLILTYLLGATVNSHESVTCNDTIVLNSLILNL